MNKDTGEFIQSGTIEISVTLDISQNYTKTIFSNFRSTKELKEAMQRCADEIATSQRIFQEEITKSLESKHDN